MVEFSGREGVDPQMADDVKTVLEEAGVSREVFDADTDGAKTSGGGNSGGRGLPLPSPVAYRLTTVEPGLKQMLTVVEMKQSIAPFRHSRSSQRRKACALRKLACLAEASQLQMELEAEASPEVPHGDCLPSARDARLAKSGQHRGFPMKT